MKTRIVNNSKEYTCIYCRQKITTKRKAQYKNKSYYHITCLFNWAERNFIYWREVKNLSSKYKKSMVVEALKKN